ncbi:hypothetical protein GCM10023185_38140 [Hymenobacter saemangeumensis]|uniref:Uncharacterized protein n=1 Tax=Hymenobacter saemangeumensis TaxID=1084522 RepID=A0ABP8IQC9_9BACT
MNAPITRDELHDLLHSLLPTVPVAELAPAVQALHLILKAGKLAKAAAPPKPKARHYTADKPVAQSLNLKR